ncbi:MAG TPA: SLC13 family permease [Spirochaetia bacterium]|nr:SLC13 family permease [Spirochaetales bacterium]HPD80665.1 SLC13 family permease [Spirochaetales bacterium]HRS65076.1 SLC13 family permease [Spirochaetia bacterium]
MKLFIIGLTVVMYGFIIAFPSKKSFIALGAALIAIVSGAAGFVEAFTVYINWNIMLIYIGSLVIAEFFIYSKVPAYIADTVIEKSPNVGLGIVWILMLTGILSAFVENVATVLVMAPIALALSKKLKMNPMYFMVGLAVMANLQGTATLVGDPPSMIFANYAHYSFNDFFWYAGKPSIFFAVQIGMVTGVLFLYTFFRKIDVKKIELDKEPVVSWFPTVLLILLIAGLAVISFFAGGVSFAAGAWCVLLGFAGIVWYLAHQKKSHHEVREIIKNLDWETILFLVGIFIVIGTIEHTGVLKDLADLLQVWIGGNVLLGFVVIVGISVLLSGFIDNVPYILVMLPVAAFLTKDLGLKPELYMFALLIGSCMGGNLTPFGASANIVAMGICKKNGYPMKFADWIKIGLPFTVISTTAASLFIWLMWR